MKKVFALLMIAVILVLSLSAVAEQQAESFIFRNGITWGMSTGEVFAQEGEGEKGESPAPAGLFAEPAAEEELDYEGV